MNEDRFLRPRLGPEQPQGRIETTWAVLRRFGYDNTLRLAAAVIDSVPLAAAPDQAVELTEPALDFLRGAFAAFDSDRDGVLSESELEVPPHFFIQHAGRKLSAAAFCPPAGGPRPARARARANKQTNMRTHSPTTRSRRPCFAPRRRRPGPRRAGARRASARRPQAAAPASRSRVRCDLGHRGGLAGKNASGFHHTAALNSAAPHNSDATPH